MRPSQALMAGGGGPLGKHGKFLGEWGNFGGQPQKGIISYVLSANKQNPFAGAAHAAIFNTWRRFSAQVLYVAPPMIFFYYTMSWAIDRNHFLNSKQGRAEFSE
ncbi:ubiquinol-cytochrome c reductase complex ubiquinone-binding protein [Annulohypoxylon truncatum]|uniref:ubiquinol-cytochrome c reductase complex ubiquinone-binding protein n=1 Tax=Annulohypoxylon truncatum TaxID=327061 RepID=UPI0020088BF8|nr:ubiquinol-cytochrome c reductase complex ubiquinone-binding protein [Annulohypoxylon truncatum]KAI1211716.1 ubiquinol-cytochrome c reductase complex ubiquinone-binding protein [Annulohypoxylon truncatum]